MGGLGYARTGKGARIEQISRDVRVMVVGGGSEEILTELAFAQERRDLESLSKATSSKYELTKLSSNCTFSLDVLLYFLGENPQKDFTLIAKHTAGHISKYPGKPL